jgi:hypothetical protein
VKTDALFAQKEVMRNPLSLIANINWVWSLFHKGQASNAVTAFKLLCDKIDKNLIVNDCPMELGKLEKFVTLLTASGAKPTEGSKIDMIA